MTMGMVTTLVVTLLMLVLTHLERQPLIDSDVWMLMVMDTRHQRKAGVSILELMHSQVIRHNGVISMKTDSEIITETPHGPTVPKTGLVCTWMGHKTKMPVQCNQEQVGKTEYSDVLIPMVMDGGTSKMHSQQNQHNGPMLMVMVMVTIRVVLKQMPVQTLVVTRPSIVLVASIPMEMAIQHLN